MSIWQTISNNPDAVIGILSVLGGLLGVDRWRKKAKASTVEQVDEWTNVAIGGVQLAVESGLLGDHEEAVTDFMRRLKVLAQVAGITLTPDHEARALAKAHQALILIGQTKLAQEAAKLRGPAEALLAQLEKLSALQAARP